MRPDVAQGILRIVAALMYFSHGTARLFGWFGGAGPDGGPAILASRFGAAGIIESILGLLLIAGLFTRPVAFIACGEMAVAYLWAHLGAGGIWWWANQGELVVLYCSLWLFFGFAGPGTPSVDRTLAARRAGRQTA